MAALVGDGAVEVGDGRLVELGRALGELWPVGVGGAFVIAQSGDALGHGQGEAAEGHAGLEALGGVPRPGLDGGVVEVPAVAGACLVETVEEALELVLGSELAGGVGIVLARALAQEGALDADDCLVGVEAGDDQVADVVVLSGGECPGELELALPPPRRPLGEGACGIAPDGGWAAGKTERRGDEPARTAAREHGSPPLAGRRRPADRLRAGCCSSHCLKLIFWK